MPVCELDRRWVETLPSKCAPNTVKHTLDSNGVLGHQSNYTRSRQYYWICRPTGAFNDRSRSGGRKSREAVAGDDGRPLAFQASFKLQCDGYRNCASLDMVWFGYLIRAGQFKGRGAGVIMVKSGKWLSTELDGCKNQSCKQEQVFYARLLRS